MEREVHFKQTLLRCLASAHRGWTIQGLPWPKVACAFLMSKTQGTWILCKGAVLESHASPQGAAFRLRHSYQIWTVLDLRNTWLATGNLLTAWWGCRIWGPDCSSPLPFTSACHTSWLTPPPLGGNPLFCVCFSLSLWHFHLLYCYITLVLSQCCQNTQSWSFPYGLKDPWCSPSLCTQPHSLWVWTRVWVASLLLNAVQCKFCTDFFPPWLCYSLRFQSFPTGPHL